MGGPLFSPVVDGRKTCSRCLTNKPVSDFYKRTAERGGYQAACRSCRSGQARDSYDPVEALHKHLWAHYRLRPDAYYSMLAAQGARCAVCRSASPGGKGWHVDHDHSCCSQPARSCGKCVRGLLCHRCNLMLGNARDSIDTLRAAIEYLGGK